MLNPDIVTYDAREEPIQPEPCSDMPITELNSISDPDLPGALTSAASKQSYYTIRFLADRDRVLNAYRAYAYFRWVDDWLDAPIADACQRLAFLERQQTLITLAGKGRCLPDLNAEETMLVDLMRSDPSPYSGLQSYIRNMMAVMRFDTYRRGRLISQQELARYTCYLSTAVTDALHYFIGRLDSTLYHPTRYLAVTGAHITHMLRDTCEDIAAGYFNVPYEFLAAHGIGINDVNSEAYRAWVRSRVHQARSYFQAGRCYLAQMPNWRFRLAGYAYIARFEVVLNIIERENYQLRPAYPERKTLRGGLSLGWLLLGMMTGSRAH